MPTFLTLLDGSLIRTELIVSVDADVDPKTGSPAYIVRRDNGMFTIQPCLDEETLALELDRINTALNS